jgi:hypothetical protein
MKKYITCTLLGFLCLQVILAQGDPYRDITQISTPYKYLNEGSFYGKNFFFETKWVKAKLLMANNSIISSDSLLYNYDKIDHRLLITTDFKRIFEIDRREFKAVLFYGRDTAYIFKHIRFINDKDLFQLIAGESSKYSLYKVVRTKLVKGSYGATSFFSATAKSSDVYLDAPEYYIFFPNREYITLRMLKKLSVQRAFKLNPDSDKVYEFLNVAGNRDYNENDLIQLVRYLNRVVL